VRELRRKKHFKVLMSLSSTRLTYLYSRLQRQRELRKDGRRERAEKAVAVVGYTL
jgi:50S ribosomal subunit-associated GTPase HflX